MTDDMVERLRGAADVSHLPSRDDWCVGVLPSFLEEAADEIERLRALVAIGDDLAYWLEDYAMFDDDDSRARTLIKIWKHYRNEDRRD